MSFISTLRRDHFFDQNITEYHSLFVNNCEIMSVKTKFDASISILIFKSESK